MFGRNKNKFKELDPTAAVAGAPLRCLNLGCGAHFHPDWVNVDLAPSDPRVWHHDLRQSLPFATETFEAVYHSHVLEHIPHGKAPGLIAECFRVLRPGGTLRVVVPDLETIARLYLQNLDAAATGDEVAADRHEWMTLELLDQMVREESGGEMMKHWRQNPMPAEAFVIERLGGEVLGMLEWIRRPSARQAPPPPVTPEEIGRFRAGGEVHQWMYDRLSLRKLLTAASFIDFRICSAVESRIPDFPSYRLDASEEGKVRKPDSLFAEAVKP